MFDSSSPNAEGSDDVVFSSNEQWCSQRRKNHCKPGVVPKDGQYKTCETCRMRSREKTQRSRKRKAEEESAKVAAPNPPVDPSDVDEDLIDVGSRYWVRFAFHGALFIADYGMQKPTEYSKDQMYRESLRIVSSMDPFK